MSARAEKEDLFPKHDFSNFAAWYRHMTLENSTGVDGARKALRRVIEGFESLDLASAGQNVRILKARFLSGNGQQSIRNLDRLEFDFDELSDGQRAIVALYTLLHSGLATTVLWCWMSPTISLHSRRSSLGCSN
jgi:hypothetical protein